MAIATMEIVAEGFDRLIAGFDKAPLEMRRIQIQAGLGAVHTVWMDATDRVPKRTGRLASSIGARMDTSSAEWIGGVGVSMEDPPYGNIGGYKAFQVAPYAAAVEEGAPEHVITARGRKHGGKDALWWKGARHPVHRVRHPGQEGKHFLRNALVENEDKIRDDFRKDVQTLLGRLKDGGF